MAYSWSTFVSELTTHLVTAWPDVVTGGIYEFDEIVRLSGEELTLPYAVFDIHAVPAANWGLVNDHMEATVDLHYVAMESTTMATLRTKLEAIADRLQAQAPFTVATVLEDGFEMDWSGEHAANAIFESKNLPYIAGSLSFRAVVGE